MSASAAKTELVAVARRMHIEVNFPPVPCVIVFGGDDQELLTLQLDVDADEVAKSLRGHSIQRIEVKGRIVWVNPQNVLYVEDVSAPSPAGKQAVPCPTCRKEARRTWTAPYSSQSHGSTIRPWTSSRESRVPPCEFDERGFWVKKLLSGGRFSKPNFVVRYSTAVDASS